MKKILSALLALPLALFLAFAVTSTTIPTRAHADEAAAAAPADNQFVDGNWFTIAEAKGEAYQTGSPTEVALQAQLALYQEAVDAKNTADAEKYAIRSWVKANYAAELGLEAAEAGKGTEAKADYDRALKYAKTAQKKGAGNGEQGDRICDDSAPAWKGCSLVEGQRAEKYIRKLMHRLPKAVRGTEGE